jgi:glycerol kinase
MNHLLVLDLGTTGNRALVVDEQLRIRGLAYRPLTQHYPRPGWVEHNPEEIFRDTVANMKEALWKARISIGDVVAIGITNQRETTVLWDRQSGKPFHRAIVWQDRRTEPECAQLKKQGLEPLVHRTTGLFLDPYFSATKLTWLLEHVSGARRAAASGDALFGTIDSWMLWKLTGCSVHATDVTNASRTMLMNLRTLAWDRDLLELFSIPSSLLPEIRTTTASFGALSSSILGRAIPITAMVGDQQSSLFGHRCWNVGDTKCTYGTGAFLLEDIGTTLRLVPNLLTTVAWQLHGQKPVYALEGALFTIGAVLEWLKHDLRLIKDFKEFDRILRRTPSSGGVIFLPALQGLGAPYWIPTARGAWLGLSRSCTRAHLLRAVAEGIVFQVADLLDAFARASGKRPRLLSVDGGLSRSTSLMSLQAAALHPNYRGLTSIVRAPAETTALGAAMLAGLGAKLWNIHTLPRPRKRTTISPSRTEARELYLTFPAWKRICTTLSVVQC